LLRDRSGSVVSVDDMRRTIWKDSPEGDRHVVDQTLSRLRKRLREQLPGHDELIRGVRGQGYSLVLPGREPPRRT
jgi:DNA-binding response OmpR family regulator